MTAVQANDIKIEYDIKGSPDCPVVILVRGLGTQLVDWPDNFVEGLLKEGYRVLVFDNRDVGLSQKFEGSPSLVEIAKGEAAPPYTLDDMAEDIAGLMDALDIEKAHILGISMGGMIVQVLAANHGDRLLSLVCVMSSSGRPGLPGPTESAAKVLAAETRLGATADEIIAAAAEGLLVCGSPGYPLTPYEALAIARRRFERCYLPEGQLRQMAAIVASGSRVDLLAGITVPTLVIHGKDDPLVPVEAGMDTAACIPGARLELIPGMGHDLPSALMPEFTRLVTQFYEEIGS